MNIIAVIPARKHSKRIPNKNIRLLDGQPLIYYSIKTALSSRYITQVIVTTDSDEIAIVSEQMGVRCVRRPESMCTDETTLDCVVYHAVRNYTYDYVVTLQPTTPLLKVENLDDAIEYSIKNDLDTCISVINDPHLSWHRCNGKMVPNYRERLNSQFLPPYYVETGAFLISRGTVVSENSRIGEHLEIYEISREEAIDINSFEHFLLADSILKQKRVGIYVNGNNTRGLGHIYRALEIADEFYCKPDIFYDNHQTKREVFGQTSHKLIPVDGEKDLFQKVSTKNYDIFINDILSTEIGYMQNLKKSMGNGCIVNFEDEGQGARYADLVFNALLPKTTFPNVKSGHLYYIVPKMFLLYKPIKIKENVKNVFVSFGGADPQNYTDRILKIVTENEYKYASFNFIVVLGQSKKNVDKLMKYQKYDNIQMHYNVNNMPELMSKSDVALISRGRTGYEIATLGIPSMVLAQNEQEETHTFISHENGFNYIGLNPSNRGIQMNLDLLLFSSAEERMAQQKAMLSNELRNGRKRVMSLINSL